MGRRLGEVDPMKVPLSHPLAAPERLVKGARGRSKRDVARNPNTPLRTLATLAAFHPIDVLQNPALLTLELDNPGDALVEALFERLLSWEQEQVLHMLSPQRRLYWCFTLLSEAGTEGLSEIEADGVRLSLSLARMALSGDSFRSTVRPQGIVQGTGASVNLYSMTTERDISVAILPKFYSTPFGHYAMREHLNFLRLLRDWTEDEFEVRINRLRGEREVNDGLL